MDEVRRGSIDRCFGLGKGMGCRLASHYYMRVRTS